MIDFEFKDKVAVITLNRPEASNAYTLQMTKDLCSKLIKAEHHSEVNVIIITGAGKHFCAGGDIKAMKAKTDMFAGDCLELQKLYEYGIQQIALTVESISKPIIAAINGAAIGAGLDLACMCDLRYSSTEAKLGETFSKLALVPGDGGAYFLIRTVGYAKAMELILSAKIIDSDEAKKIGLVHDVFPSDQFRTRVFEIAETISKLSNETLRFSKKAMKQAYRGELSQHLDLVSTMQAIVQRSNAHEKSLK